MSTIFQPTRLVGAIAIAMGLSSTAFAQLLTMHNTHDYNKHLAYLDPMIPNQVDD